MIKKQLSFVFLLLTLSLFAQKEKSPPCLSDRIIDQLIRENPEAKERLRLMDKEAGQFNNQRRSGPTSVITIPVVVYVVHGGVNNPENISDAQVNSQITALNDYFLDYGLKFCLATKAGTGTTSIPLQNTATNTQATPGIIHVQSATLTNNTFATSTQLAATAHGTVTANRYLRIWVVNKIENGNSVKGYATFPNGATFDGIVMRYDVFGKTGCSGCNLDPLFLQGKTLIHEVGHYLGLYHTFYESCTETNCATNGDRVCDTPPGSYANYGCSPVDTCTGDSLPDDVLNYMDYSNECSDHFTPGQVQRMMGILNTQRAQLFSNSNLIYTAPCGTAPMSAAFTADNYTVCQGTATPVQFTADAQIGVEYVWDFGDGTTYTSSSNTASHLYNNTAGSPYTVKLIVTNTNTNQQVSSSDQVFVTVCTPINNSDSRWFIGENSMLKFGSGLPVFDQAYNATGISAETTAIQNDASGNLMFYTDKQFIYNSSYAKTNPSAPLLSYTHSAMRNSNSVLIVPKPVVTGSPTQYYIFTNSHVDGQADNGFKYSIVNSNGSLTTSVKVPVTTPSSGFLMNGDGALVGGGGITAIPKSDGYWIITCLMKNPGSGFNEHYLMVYNLTATGLVYRSMMRIAAVNLSEGGGMRIKVSPDGNRIAVGTYFSELYLFDFNKFSGVIMSNPATTTDKPINISGTGHTVNGLAFSPDSKLLYAAVGDKIYQYNLSIQNSANSRVIVGKYINPSGAGNNLGSGFGEIQAGPDGKLYIAPKTMGPYFSVTELAVIHKPNQLASGNDPGACHFSMHGPKNATSNLRDELPNMVNAKNATVYNNTISYYPKACGEYRFFPNIVGAIASSTYSWEVKNSVTGVVLSTTTANVFTKTFTATEEGVYTVTVKNGTTVLASVGGIIVDFPDAPVILGSTNACSTSNQPSHNSVVLPSGDTAVWSIIGGSGVISGLNNQAEVTINWKALPGTIKVVVTNKDGCVTEMVKIIESTCFAGANDYVTSVKNHNNQKFYFAGNFTAYNGVTRNKIARLNTDMGLDEAFDPGVSANSSIEAIAIQSNGRILVGGDFTDISGNARVGIARLLDTGAFDTSFVGTGVASNGDYGLVKAIAVQSNQKIIIAGNFNEYNGQPANSVARINADGSKDLTFNSTALPAQSWTIYSIAVQSDSKILVGGSSVEGFGFGPSVLRLNADGSIDTTFTPLTLNGHAATLKVLSSGKILVGGDFNNSFGGIGYYTILRLNANGSVDTTFVPDLIVSTGNSTGINAIEIMPDGKIVVGGGFIFVGENLINKVVRLTPAGLHDTTFNPGTGFQIYPLPPRGALGGLSSMALFGDNLVAGGWFTQYNGIAVNNIEKINMNTNTIIGRPANMTLKKEEVSLGISVYPNPASDYLTVTSLESEIETVEIYNLIGQLVKSVKAAKGENTISLQQLPVGVYILKVLNDGKMVLSEKIVKK